MTLFYIETPRDLAQQIITILLPAKFSFVAQLKVFYFYLQVTKKYFV